MRYRFVGDHIESLGDGTQLVPLEYVELSDEQLKDERAKVLLDDDLLMEIDEGAGPTEAAEELAKKEKIDLGAVRGTGAEGRITVDDVRSAVAERDKEGDE